MHDEVAAAPRVAADERRQALVRAAYHQIAARGFEGLRTREVAQQVHLNVATLHYYFPTKESLIRGVVEHAMSRFQTTLAPHGRPGDELRAHLVAVATLLREEPDLGQVMAELALRSARDPSIQAILGDTSQTWQRGVRILLRRAAAAARIRPELDSDGAAALIVSVLGSMTLPVLGDAARTDGALQELLRWLGLEAQSTD
ncbi:MAG: TetR/AcrR family transcriptional regulator [Candidatus Dormibacteraeota bacterium]|nr:TetR/AcrR family transcriptional regulator [Candidatus Dormibacteraeota bacterium]